MGQLINRRFRHYRSIVVFGLAAGYFYNRNIQKKIDKGELKEEPEVVTVDSECCGQHQVCEKESLLAAVSKQIEYYDDEELDRFKGRTAEEYSPEEADEFREVMYTMKEEEVAGWCRSLQLRGIELPDEIKDEALLGSLFASIACGIIGTYIVTRRLVFISGGITHASFGGIGIGLYTGISPLLSAAVFSVLSAFGVEWLSKNSDMREDSAIAVFWTFGMAIGIIFSFLAPGFTPDLSSYLFGNILTINRTDILLLAILSMVLAVFFTLFLRPIMAIAFDREFARSQRMPVTFFEYALMMLIALTIVSCLRMVGIVLAISLLTLPQMTANLFTYSFKRIIWLSIGIGYLSCLGGLFLSYKLQIPSGAAIIFISILFYALSKIIRLITTRRR